MRLAQSTGLRRDFTVLSPNRHPFRLKMLDYEINSLYQIGSIISEEAYNGGNFKLAANKNRNKSKKVEAPEVGKSSWALRPQLPLTTMMR